MAQVARGKQVLCVTHLPQIAAMADTHFSVRRGSGRDAPTPGWSGWTAPSGGRSWPASSAGPPSRPPLLESAEELLRQAEQQKQV